MEGLAGAREARWRLSWLIPLLLSSWCLISAGTAQATALPSTITENMTLTAAGSPYTGSPTVEAGVTLKAEPGVKFNIGKLIVKGTLVAEGTAEYPVAFTSGAKEPKPGQWSYIKFEPGSGTSVLDHTEIAYGASGEVGALEIWGASPKITHSTFRKNEASAILVHGGNPEIAYDTFTYNGHYFLGRSTINYNLTSTEPGQVNVHDNTMTENGGAAVNVYDSVAGEINVNNNMVEGGTGIKVSNEVASGASASMGGNTVVKTTGEHAISYSGSNIPNNITGNTLKENASNQIYVAGKVVGSSTWSKGEASIGLGEVVIEKEATLTISPGVTLCPGKIIVKGALLAEGTTAEPVAFTSCAKEPKPGTWNYIKFEPSSGASVLDHTEIAYGASGEVGALEIRGASPTITHSTFLKNQASAILVHGGNPEIAYDTFTYNGHYFLGRSTIDYNLTSTEPGQVNVHDNTIIESGGAAINVGDSVAGEVNVNNNTVEGTGGAGITVTDTPATGAVASMGGNVVTHTSGEKALSYSGSSIPNNITENTLRENVSNQIYVAGTVTNTSTWGKGAGPVRLGEVTVAKEATLTIKPGAVLFPGKLIVKGTLKAEGTATEPIAFTSGAKEPKPGTWNYITFEPGSGASVLDHTEVAYGARGEVGALEIWGASPRITNSTFFKNEASAILVHGGSPEIASDTFIYNGHYFLGRATISYLATSKEPGVNIHDNLVEASGGAGISVENTSAVGAGGVLSGNLVIGSGGIGMTYSGNDIPGDITENTLLANVSNYLRVSGTVAHSSTWNKGGTIVQGSGEVSIASGVTLTIKPGVVFRPSWITVKGTLKTEGTAKEPVVFTGASEASAGEWSYIRFEPGSGESVLDHTEIAFGGSGSGAGMIEARGSHPTITNSTIRKSANYGIKVTESGSPRIEWNRFRNNTTGGLSYSGTGKLSAPNNDWNCASGPKPAGCGDSVSSTVEWKPAAQLPELDGPCRGKESQCGEGADPVSLATGHLDYSHRDLLLTNKSAVPLEFARTYDSGSAADTGLGVGWSQTGLASATELEGGASVMVLRQDGRQDLFQKTETGYKAPSGVTDALAKVEGTFQLTTLQNTVDRFDSSGRLASITDDHGLKTTYAYSAEGRLATITDPSGQTLTFTYNASNHITSVKDSTGREVKFAYSAAGDLESATDALGGLTKYAYDSQHRLTQITDPRGNVILKNTYDSLGRITEQRDGLEHLWKLAYAAGETTVSEPQGGQLKYGFDSQSRVVSETDQLGHTTAIGYDAAGNVSEVVQPGGAKWIFGHDAAGNLTSVKDPEGGERSYGYDSKNRLTAYTDARGGTWGYEWSAAGDLTKITDPEGGETTLTYNASGQPLTATDPDEHKSEFSYDTRGNQTSATDPLGHKTSFEYNTRNYLTAKTLPGLKAEAFERDALGDLLARTTPEGHTTKYAYDANGLPTQVTDPAEGVWKIERNAMERPMAYIDPLGQEAKVTYNGNLRPTKVVNRRGKETSYAYDLANQMTEVKRPEGETWQFGYDARGNRTSTLDPRLHETTYVYDLLDRMTEAKEPLSVTTKYSYDANGDLTEVTDPRGNATSYGYDKLGRLTEIAQPLEKTTSFAYDPAGNELTKTTAAGTLEYGHDAANRLTSVTSGESPLRSYGYDAANRLTSASDAEGHKIEIAYTEEGRPSTISDGRGQSLTRSYDSRGNLVQEVDSRGTLEYGYDKLGRMTSLTDPQGKTLGFAYDPEGDLTEVTRPGGVTTTNLYDEAGRLAETTSQAAEPLTVLESLKYGYDAAGNVTSKLDQRLEQETSYAYDALNRLTEFNPPGEGATSYAYDAAGNRTEAGGTTYSFNALNQPTESSAGTTYSYDAAGRLTGEVNGSEETTFAWDPFDHLAKVESPGGNVTYSFDGLERLSEHKSGEATQVFHYGDLGDMPTYTANGEGKTMTSYVQGPRGLVEQRSGEATSFPLTDAHGDVTALTTSTGEVESRQTFDPWGTQLSGPSLEMGYLGAWGRPTDPTSGLVQMGARSYDPTLGSFASEDPVLGHLGFGVSSNRYPYVWDNPTNRYDLNGRDVCVFGACAEDAAEDIGGAASDTWETGSYIVTHPGEAATNAVNYWAESESPASYVFGPLATLGDMTLNPDRIGYYLEKVSPAQMAATGILAAGTVGVAGLTTIATTDCLAATAGFEALHVCGQIAATGGGIAATGGILTVEVAKQ
jgi:RHS repeat-associated protein